MPICVVQYLGVCITRLKSVLLMKKKTSWKNWRMTECGMLFEVASSRRCVSLVVMKPMGEVP